MIGSNWDFFYASFLLRHIYPSDIYNIVFSFSIFTTKPKISPEKNEKLIKKNTYFYQPEE